MRIAVASLAGIVTAGVLVASGFAAGRVAQGPSTDGTVDRRAVEGIVYDYLIANPEVLVAAQTALTAREEQRQQQARAQVLQAEQAALFSSTDDAVIGNPQGSRTIVEFFDYNCGYCKQALGDMEAMVEADPDLRFVLKEFPILGPDSQAAHLVAAAVRKTAPETYAEYHVRLLGSTGRANEQSAVALAKELGVDEAKLRAAMADPEIAAGFNRTYELANKLSITGTPAYVVGGDVVFGAVGADELTSRLTASN